MTHPELASTLNYDIVHSPFNEFLNVGVGLGLLPLCLYIAFTVYVLIKAHRIHSKLFYPLLTFQILSCSYFPFRIIPVAAIYILFCGMVLNQTEKKAMGIKIPIGISKGVTVCFSLVLWLGASISTYSYLCWEKGLASASKERKSQQAVSTLKRLTPGSTETAVFGFLCRMESSKRE